MRVQELRGMQATMAEKLVAAGIKSSDDLLAAGKTPAGRKDPAARVGADPKEVLEMLNRANWPASRASARSTAICLRTLAWIRSPSCPARAGQSPCQARRAGSEGRCPPRAHPVPG